MLSVTPDSSVATFPTSRTKSTDAHDVPGGHDFSSLVDDNIDAANNQPVTGGPRASAGSPTTANAIHSRRSRPPRQTATSSAQTTRRILAADARAKPDQQDNAPPATTPPAVTHGKITQGPKGEVGKKPSSPKADAEVSAANALQQVLPVAVVVTAANTSATAASTPSADAVVSAAADATISAAAAAALAAEAAANGSAQPGDTAATSTATETAKNAEGTTPAIDPAAAAQTADVLAAIAAANSDTTTTAAAATTTTATPGTAKTAPKTGVSSQPATTSQAAETAVATPAPATVREDNSTKATDSLNQTTDASQKKQSGVAEAPKSDVATKTKEAAADLAPVAPNGHQTHTLNAEPLALSAEASQRAAASALQVQPQTINAAAPLSASALSVALATTAAVPLNGLAMEISAHAQIGRNRFEIRLDPPELGRIDVRLDVDTRGHVTSHLTVEKPETLDLLRRDAPQLQRALEDAGLKTGNNGLQFSLRDQSSSNGRDDSNLGKNAQRLIISEDDTVPAETAGRSYGRMLGSSSGIDIRV